MLERQFRSSMKISNKEWTDRCVQVFVLKNCSKKFVSEKCLNSVTTRYGGHLVCFSRTSKISAGLKRRNQDEATGQLFSHLFKFTIDDKQHEESIND